MLSLIKSCNDPGSKSDRATLTGSKLISNSNINLKELSWRFLQQIIHEHIHQTPHHFSPELFEQLDQPELVRLIHEHRLDLIAYPILIKYTKDNFQFKTRIVKKRQKNDEMKRCLIELTRLFEKNNIPMVVLKGIPLNTQLYGEGCVRISNDIDLLVKRKDFLLAHQSLLSAGFLSDFILNPQWLENDCSFLLNVMKDLIYTHPQLKFRIELHWQATQMQGLNFELMENIIFSRLSPGKFVSVLSVENNFLYLCIHAALHNWQRLQWLVDIAVFYKKTSFSWEELISIAKQYRVIRPLLEAKILLSEFNIFLPSIPCKRLDLMCAKFRLRHAKKLQRHHILKPYTEVFYFALLCPSLLYKLKYLVGLILQGPISLQALLVNPKQTKTKLFCMSIYQKITLQKHCR